MSTLKLLLVGLGSRVTIIFIGMANTIVLARWLGPAGVGEYFLLLRLVAVATVLAGLGLRHSANVFSGHHEEWAGTIHKIMLRFTLLSWVGASVVGAGVVWTAREMSLLDSPRIWVWLAFVILPLSMYANIWNGMMIGRGWIWQLNLVQLVISALSLLLTFIFIVGLSGGPLEAMLIYLLASVIQSVIMLILAFRVGSGRKMEEPPAELSRQMLSFGLRGYPGTIADLLWLHIPVFLLNAFHGAAAVGIFSIAQQLVEKLSLPIQAMQDAIFKKLSVLPRHEAVAAMNRYVRLTLAGMAALTVAGMILIPLVVTLLFGTNYLRAAQLCRLLLPGTVITSACILLSIYFLGQLRRPGLLSIFAWLQALLNLTLSLVLIPRMAETGAALALVTAQIISGSCLLIFYLRSTRTSIRQLVYITGEDVAIVRRQIGPVLGLKGTEDE
ncbi:MAG TPA: oligosaccharide flippase family protein [Pyrinomonadaceae bacterium]|jgi:O-antigen/teichoic acid export membrane protein|nr:oligosaccharide flippase family protein [Pyrinomonadaceae bacterium]